MKTIWYLLDLWDNRLIESYEGVNDIPPEEATADAERRTKETGHTHAIAYGKEFFQKDA